MIKTDIAAINTDLVPNMLEARLEAKNLKEVADQFEAIFLNQILKQSRQTKLAETPFDSSAGDHYQSMLDNQYAGMLSSKVNLGIAEALIRQFGRDVT